MASVPVLQQDIGSLFYKHHAYIFISGPSGSRKTEFVKKMIEYREDLFDILPQHIVWCYKEWQSAYNILQEREGSKIRFILGIPDDEDDIVADTSAPHLVIFEDMLGDKDEEKIKLWFTRKGHHRHASVVYITQSKKISNDQELIQSDTTSCPQNQTGNN